MALCSAFASFLAVSDNSSQVQFFTLETLFSAAGATTAVFTITSVLHGFLPKVSPRYFALAFSWLLTLAGISVEHQGWTLPNVFLALVNGIVIYAAAVGVNNVSTSAPPAGGAAQTAVGPARTYRWWP
jgi:hypothetical protein